MIIAIKRQSSASNDDYSNHEQYEISRNHSLIVYISLPQVEIDIDQNFISVYNNGDGVPVEIHKEEGVYVPEMIFGHLLTSSNYNDSEKKTTGGRNGYGAKLANIFSTEFTIETADGQRQRRYKQV